MWIRVIVATWMLVMFLLQAFSAYDMYRENKGMGASVYVMMFLAGSWLFIAGILHQGGFW